MIWNRRPYKRMQVAAAANHGGSRCSRGWRQPLIRNLLRMSIDCSHATPSARQKARALEPKPKPPSEKANESMWRVSTGVRERPAVGPRELRHRQSPWPSGRSGMRVCTETWVKNLTSLFAQQTGRRRTLRPVGCCHDPAHTLAALLPTLLLRQLGLR